MQPGYPRESQFSFKKSTNIHTEFLHEANHLMLLQGIIETLDIPTIYNHGDAGEGMALLLPVLVLMLLCFTLVLTEFPNKGTSKG
jgi:hypothetical protein